MNRFFFFLIWCAAGFCVYLGGCSVSLSAEKLEAAGEIRAPNQQAPPVIEVHYDSNNDKSRTDKAESSAGR